MQHNLCRAVVNALALIDEQRKKIQLVNPKSGTRSRPICVRLFLVFS